MNNLDNMDSKIAINTINSISNKNHFNKIVDVNKYKVEEMTTSQQHEAAKSLIRTVVGGDKIEMEEKLKDFYLRSVCEEIYGEEDTSDTAEQGMGYLASAIWNDREGIEKRLFELLSEESHVNYYKTAINHYDMSKEIDDEFKSVITSMLNRYDR